MATLVIRPDSVTSSSGFADSGDGLRDKINDNNTNTSSAQNSTSAQVVCSFANDSTYSSATINSVTFSIIAALGGRAEEASISFVVNSNKASGYTKKRWFEKAEVIPIIRDSALLLLKINLPIKKPVKYIKNWLNK